MGSFDHVSTGEPLALCRVRWLGWLAEECGLLARALLTRHALLLALLALLAALAAYQRPHRHGLAIAEPEAYGYLRGFHLGELSTDGQTFRWSREQASISFPGGDPLRQSLLVLRVNGGSRPATDQLTLGPGPGQQLQLAPVAPDWRTYRVLAAPSGWTGALDLNLAVPPLQSPDPRTLGVALSWAGASELRGTGLRLPAPQALLLLLGLGLFCLVLGRRAGVDRRLSLALGIVLLLSVALVLRFFPRQLLVFAGGLLWVLLGAYVLVVAYDRLVLPLLRRGGVSLSAAARAGLLALVGITFVLKLGGMLYPRTLIVDMEYHVRRTWMIRYGNFWELYLPNRDFTPFQWEAGFTIPYSPMYYILNAPFTYAPWSLRVTLPLLTALIEALILAMIVYIVRRSALGELEAVLAAALYGLLPMTYWELSSGWFPTMWGYFLFMVFLSVRFSPLAEGRHARRWQVATLALALLSYPTVALFLSAMLLWLGLLELARGRRLAAWRELRTYGLGLVIAIALYYVWHIPDVVERLLPAFARAVDSGQRFGEPVRTYDLLLGSLLANYGWPLLVLALLGALLLARRGAARGLQPLLLCWLAVFPIFGVLGRWFELTDKHAAWILVPVALLAALPAAALLRRLRWAGVVLVGSGLLLLTASSVSYWYSEMVTRWISQR